MLGNRIFGGGIAALGILFFGCARTQQVQPTTPTPVAKAPSAAPTPIAGEVPRSADAPAPEARAPLDPIHFDFDKYDIHQQDRELLVALSDWLAGHVDRALTIAGHCDERGTVEYNIALGDRRANAAREYLTRLGIDSVRIKAISYGEERPADRGHNEEAWAKNRRDEFQVEQRQHAQR
jgi:peptidoglycan-associated lipoprotein